MSEDELKVLRRLFFERIGGAAKCFAYVTSAQAISYNENSEEIPSETTLKVVSLSENNELGLTDDLDSDEAKFKLRSGSVRIKSLRDNP